MDNSTIPVKEDTIIVIRTSADLYLSGGDQADVRLFSSEERVQISREDNLLRIENHSGLDLMVPHGSNIKIERVGGSAFLQDLGMVEIDKVGGELALQRLGQVEIGKVGGSLTVRDVSGPFRVQRIGGELMARGLESLVTLEAVGGDADVQGVGEGEFILRAGGDAQIYLTRSMGRLVSVRAGGDVALHLPPEVNARFEVVADSEEIHLNLNHQADPFDGTIEQRRHEFIIGEGEARVELRGGGDCLISDEPAEPSSLNSEFERIETSWQNARENRARFGWPGHFDPGRSVAWADMIGRRAQEAARRAEMRVGRHGGHGEHGRHEGWERFFQGDFTPPVPPTPPTPPMSPQQTSRTPVSEQERMLVLQMLQDGKVSVEQAEALLRALEGK